MSRDWSKWASSREVHGAEFTVCSGGTSFAIYRHLGKFSIRRWGSAVDPIQTVASPFESFEAAEAAWEIISEGGTK